MRQSEKWFVSVFQFAVEEKADFFFLYYIHKVRKDYKAYVFVVTKTESHSYRV